MKKKYKHSYKQLAQSSKSLCAINFLRAQNYSAHTDFSVRNKLNSIAKQKFKKIKMRLTVQRMDSLSQTLVVSMLVALTQ